MSIELRNYDIERAIELSDEIVKRSEEEGYKVGLARGLSLIHI